MVYCILGNNRHGCFSSSGGGGGSGGSGSSGGSCSGGSGSGRSGSGGSGSENPLLIELLSVEGDFQNFTRLPYEKFIELHEKINCAFNHQTRNSYKKFHKFQDSSRCNSTILGEWQFLQMLRIFEPNITNYNWKFCPRSV
ncbi:hypothetical protein PV328_008338 [Microctonus aethiopoides]|uniref:Uncharacterized protein n=1 Tax=Microctonus aethiopoides TaxID=144406 RepID=A0AA39KQU9_9HYME|nr:hypothetical protein PV328_008338 [Microctonus aethiopoides]